MPINDSIAAALERSTQAFIAANPLSEARAAAAGSWMPGGNTRTVIHYSPFPLAFAGGEGARLTDLDGHVYRDYLNEFSAGLYGHSNPTILATIREVSANGMTLGGPNVYEAELARLVSERFPSIELVRFCNSGTEANLSAIGAARVYTGRTMLMGFAGGYHGSAVKFSKKSLFDAPFETVIGSYNDVEQARTLIKANADKLAAIIVEPMLGSGGCIAADREFLAELRDLATRYGIILIFDEVMTSRLHPGGLQELVGVRPDLTTLGKYLGGGCSFGAFGGSAAIMAMFDPAGPDPIVHPGTFNNNVLSMAAGVAGLTQVFTAERAIQLSEHGNRLRERLNAAARARGVAVQVTGYGSMMSIHPQRDTLRQASDVLAAPDTRALLHLELIARGIYLARRGYISLSLALDDADHDAFVAALDDVLETHRHILQ